VAPGDAFAEELRGYFGMWVAVKDQAVIASAATPGGLIRLLRDRGVSADSVFRVPPDPMAEMGENP
jgi:hypothetical protein